MDLFDIFEKAGHELFFVGGFVRDLLLAKMHDDLDPDPNCDRHRKAFWERAETGVIDTDYATSARPEETIKILEGAGLKAIPIGIEFGTIQTIIDGNKVEVTTYRCDESYTKGSRKPGVVFGDNIEDDLRRRDFTFNAIAMRKDHSVVDPFGGYHDLVTGLITTPDEPHISFTDDPLRMLRACRFIARGMGQPDQSTGWALSQLRHEVHKLSAERVFEEMTKLLMSKTPSKGLEALAEFGLLRELFPELSTVRDFREDQGKYHHLPVWEHTLLVVDSSHASPTVRWAALFHDIAKPMTWSRKGKDVHFYQHDRLGSEVWEDVAERLKTSKEFKEHISQLIYEHQNVRGAMGDKAIRRLIHRLGDRLQDLLLLREADIVGHKPSLMQSSLDDLNQLVRRVQAVQNEGTVHAKLPTGTGNKVAEALGIKPGKELGIVMKQLQQMVVDGELSPESDFVEAAKRLWIGEQNGAPG